MLIGNKEQMIKAFEDVGEPLTDENIECLREVEATLKKAGMPTNFALIETKCRICSNRQTDFAPIVADLDNLQCKNCGNKSCQEIEPGEFEE